MFSWEHSFYLFWGFQLLWKYNPDIIFKGRWPLPCFLPFDLIPLIVFHFEPLEKASTSHSVPSEICAHLKVRCREEDPGVAVELGQHWSKPWWKEEWWGVFMSPPLCPVLWSPFPNTPHCHHPIVCSCTPLSELWVGGWTCSTDPRLDLWTWMK